MSDIFLSYKSENRAQAKIIAETIGRYGYSVWWDRIIPPGKTFDQVIEEALDASKCVVALWSKESVSSDWVKNEVREGARRHILVPVLIENAKIPFEFRHIQAAQLIDWKGEMPNPEFELLLRSIGEIVGRPPAAITESEEKLKVGIETAIKMICPDCGHEYEKGWKFCEKCGINLDEGKNAGIENINQNPYAEKKYCPNCGHPFIPGDKYCEECGTKLT